ncbi:MAG: SNF2-related protein [Balneolales bacterium]
MKEKFSLHEKVELKGKPHCKGIIDECLGKVNGEFQYYVLFYAGKQDKEIISEANLLEQAETQNPYTKLIEGRVSHYRNFSLSHTYHKIENEVNNTISTLKASKTLFKPHQFKPLIKFLNSMHHRVLIADEVGLGKTIEAGHILLEMHARKMLNKVLVVCPRSLLKKWQAEMEEKFEFEFDILESRDFLEIIKKEKEGSLKGHYSIITYDKFSMNKELQKALETHTPQVDLLICDEVQALRNHTTNRYKTLYNLIIQSRAALFLSATPINNSIEDLYNLLRLLEPERYHNKIIFDNDIEANKPFIRALNSLNAGEKLPDIAGELKESKVTQTFSYADVKEAEVYTVDELFKNDSLYQRVIDGLQKGKNTPENRVFVQRDLSDLNTLNTIYTRTKKRDVEENRTTRRPYKCAVTLSEPERQYFDAEVEKIHSKADSDRPQLGILSNMRELASSMPGYMRRRERVNGLEVDSKYEELRKVVDEVVTKEGKKLIIFAFYKQTLFYLNERLKGAGVTTALIYGGNSKERSNILYQFENDNDIKVLLSSQVGAEGLDMQFCDAIVNYDLPWNPMVVEQRIGRIDRIGQESQVLHIYNMVVKCSIEEKIYDRLLDKIDVFRESLGDLEAILADGEDLFHKMEKLEYELYSPNLSGKELDERIEQTTQAIINQREDLKVVGEEMTDMMVNDIYFQNEVDRIVKNVRYVSEKDLYNYLESLISNKLEFVNLKVVEKGIYRFWLQKRDISKLFAIIEAHIEKADMNLQMSLNRMYSEFKRTILNNPDLKITFDSEIAFHNKKLVYINSYHPIIYVASREFEKEILKNLNTFRFSLTANDEVLELFPRGHFLLLTAQITLQKKMMGEERSFHYLHPIVADFNGDELQIYDEEKSMKFLSLCHKYVSEYSGELTLSKDLLKEVRSPILEKIDTKTLELQEDEKIRIHSRLKRMENQTRDYVDFRIHQLNSRLKKGKGIEVLIKDEIEKLENNLSIKLDKINDYYIHATKKEQSASHVVIE